MSKTNSEGPEHRFRFAERWQRKRQARSPKAMWMTIVLDALLIALIFGMIYVAMQAWK
jgi:hypothetical protein